MVLFRCGGRLCVACSPVELLSHMLHPRLLSLFFAFVFTIIGMACSQSGGSNAWEILNVSYDPTREFFRDFNREFIAYWRHHTGQEVTIRQSHGGSGKQTRSVMDGLEAHVVTLALAYDIDAISAKSGLIAPDWEERLPNHSVPYTSTIVFLVREGNPKNIHDWDDLIRSDVEVITPNPKTSGGARWNYLATWGAAYIKALEKAGVDSNNVTVIDSTHAQQQAEAFVTALYRRVPLLDSGARAATTTFAQRGIGDVLITWENEALMALKVLKRARIEMVVPSVSILCEPPVAYVDAVVQRRNTEQLARAYLEYLYTPVGQRLAAKHHFRPVNFDYADINDRKQFKPLVLFTVRELFGGWAQAHEMHFEPGGTFDRIFTNFERK